MPPAPARLLRAVLATVLLLLLVPPRAGRAQTACGTPGRDGPGGTLSTVVNTYWPGTANAAAGTTSISVGAALTSAGATSTVAAGDLLLVIQMQDATINSTNTSAYGSGGTTGSGLTSAGTAGQYEYVVATGALTSAAGTLTIKGAGTGGGLLYAYTTTSGTTTPRKRFQVVRVPQYSSAAFGSGLTAAAWNGTAGGVLAVDVAGQLTLGGTVSVDGRGFRGGAGRKVSAATKNTSASTDYVNLSTVNSHGQKGEGVAGTPRYTLAFNATALADETGDAYPGGGTARGAPGNAGGGGTDADPTGNSLNSGGGGGAGAGAGGQGGRSYSVKLDIGGRGGAAFTPATTRLVFGGGGGAGSSNDGTGSPALGLASSGAAGGGLVLVRAGSITGAGTITANGAPANNTVLNDGSGGGGGGGGVLVYSAAGSVGTLTVQARGGTGGTNTGGGMSHGPGGGGGGGYVALSGAAAIDVTGGASGTTAPDATYGTSFSAAAGVAGASTTALTSTLGASPTAACVPVLTVSKSTSTASVTAGNTATYTITVVNAASRDSARQLSVLDSLPAGMKFAGATTPMLANATRPTTVAPAAGDSIVNFGTFVVAGGGSVSITFSVTVAYTAAPGTRQNSATATYLDPARAAAGGTASARYAGTSATTEDVAITGVPDLRIAKAHAGNFVVGQPGAYTLSVTNAGTAATSATVAVTDTLPAGLNFTSGTGTGWTCSATGQVVACTSTTAVASGAAAATVTLNVGVAAAAAAAVTNTARVSGGGEPAALAADNAASDPATVNRVDLAVGITDSSKTFVVGQSGAYVLSVANAGTAGTFGTSTLSVTLPAGLSYASAAGTGWACASSSAQAASCTRSDTLAASAAWPSVRVQVGVAAAAAPSVTTSAAIATPNDVAAANNTASDTTAVITVGLTVTGGGTTDRLPSRGGAVSYSQTYVVTNTGSASDAFTLAASLAPGASVTVATTNGQAGASGGGITLAPNASANVVVTYTVADGATAGATDTVRLAAASSTVPATTARGAAVARVVRAGLQITKQAYRDDGTTLVGVADRVLPGQYVRYKITVASAGTADAVTVHVVDPLPAQLAFDSYTTDAAGWTITTANATLTADLAGTLAAGQVRYFWLRARVM